MKKQTIGEFLATLRKANGYTQQEVADKLGISNRTLSGWECNNVLPDILLLPALAELYGVTVDEILAGQRGERNDVALSSNSEKRILKNKIARFSMQSWILLGIIITGMALAGICAFVEVVIVSWVGFPWWRVLLFVGAVAVIVCLAILLAFWKGAELFVDESVDGYSSFVLIMRKRMANNFYVSALSSFLAAILVGVALSVSNSVHIGGIIACVAFGVFAILLFLTGWLMYRDALIKYGGESARHATAMQRNFFWAVGFWGMFPFVLSVILAIVLGCVQFESKTTIYKNNVSDFVAYMETLFDGDIEKPFPLSQLAKSAEIGKEIDLGDGYTAIYHLTDVEIQYKQTVYLPSDDGDEMEEHQVTVSTYAPLISVNGDQTITFYNLRYWHNGEIPTYYYGRYVIYEGHIFERAGDGLAYVYLIMYDYSAIGYAVAFPVIIADLIVCALLCVWKRYKYKVKL